MNDEPATADEQEDAAFRARLAPLASEVLPARPAGEPPHPPAFGRRQPAVVLARAGLAPPMVKIRADSPAAEPAPAFAWRWWLLVVGAFVLATVSVVVGVTSLGWRWPRSEQPAPVSVVVPPAAPAVRAVPEPTPQPPASNAMVGLLIERGEAALADGDIIAARLLFERAAGLGSAVAARRAGETYDIDFLLRAGARGIRADASAAAGWYRKAAALGDAEAKARLARMEARTRP